MKPLDNRTYIIGLTPAEFSITILFSSFVFTITLVLLETPIFLLALSASFFTFIFLHMGFTASRYVILPGLMGFLAFFQCVGAPILSYYFPPRFSLFTMAVPMEDYLAFALPGTVLLWLGVHLPLVFSGSFFRENTPNVPLSRNDRTGMDMLIILGLFLNHFSDYLPLLGFFYYILAQLRFVGVFGWMFSKTKGWVLRAALVYIDLLVYTASGGIFYELILWCGFLFIAVAYIQKWKWKFFVYFFLAVFLVSVFNEIKKEYRYQIQNSEFSPMRQILLLGNLMGNFFKEDNEYMRGKDFGDKLVRYNQGWIVSRVMATVPNVEPYAGGESIKDALVSSFVPRLLSPEKTGAVSPEFFARYTNLPAPLNTSFGLGIIGEMYANFGKFGGIIGTFVYAFFLGLLFIFFLRRARDRVLWWAWSPFVFIFAVMAEWNIVDVLNHIVKSIIVMFIFLWLMAVFKLRLWQKNPSY